jgi:hypothetical protein
VPAAAALGVVSSLHDAQSGPADHRPMPAR